MLSPSFPQNFAMDAIYAVENPLCQFVMGKNAPLFASRSPSFVRWTLYCHRAEELCQVSIAFKKWNNP